MFKVFRREKESQKDQWPEQVSQSLSDTHYVLRVDKT